MYRAFLFALILAGMLWHSQPVGGQEPPLLPKNYDRVLEMPGYYNKPKREIISAFPPEEREGTSWIVYSDRGNNRTYTQRGGNQELARLGYMDKFYVVDEEEDWVRLAVDPQKPKDLNLSSAARDYGWIKKTKLLVWRHCLVTEVGEIARKAMILNTVEHLKNLYSDNVEPDIVRFRSGPDPNASSFTGHTSHLFEFFFVYKTEGDYVLLGKQVGVSRNDDSRRSSMVGWAPRERMTFWDSRVAVEPNWEAGAVEERRIGLGAKFFADKSAARDYRDGEAVAGDILWQEGAPSAERPPGSWRRFPVLRWEEDEGIFRAGVMGQIYGITRGEIDALFDAKSRGKTDRQVERARRINVVFVVDGTTSMIPYFRSMAEGIKQSMESIQRQETVNTFRFGAVVYRDYAEGNRLVESVPLDRGEGGVVSFLNGITEGDRYDRDHPEAVFYGLYRALRTSGFVPGETNAIVLVGDAGSHDRADSTNVSPDRVVEALVAYGCHFMAVQVHHPSVDDAYDDFISQTKSVMKRMAEKVYNSQEQISDANQVKATSYWDSVKTDSKRHYLLHNSSYIASAAFLLCGIFVCFSGVRSGIFQEPM